MSKILDALMSGLSLDTKIADLDADSLDMVDAAIELEELTHMEIDDATVNKLETLDDIKKLLDGRS